MAEDPCLPCVEHWAATQATGWKRIDISTQEEKEKEKEEGKYKMEGCVCKSIIHMTWE